jgi:hypothetical protein
MAWEISDPYGVEDQIQARGRHVWESWEYMRPIFLDDPYPTNQHVRVTESIQGFQVWVPQSEVYVAFFLTDDHHVLLLDSKDLEEEFRL